MSIATEHEDPAGIWIKISGCTLLDLLLVEFLRGQTVMEDQSHWRRGVVHTGSDRGLPARSGHEVMLLIQNLKKTHFIQFQRLPSSSDSYIIKFPGLSLGRCVCVCVSVGCSFWKHQVTITSPAAFYQQRLCISCLKCFNVRALCFLTHFQWQLGNSVQELFCDKKQSSNKVPFIHFMHIQTLCDSDHDPLYNMKLSK